MACTIECVVLFVMAASGIPEIVFRSSGNQSMIHFDGNALHVPGYCALGGPAGCNSLQAQIHALKTKLNALLTWRTEMNAWKTEMDAWKTGIESWKQDAMPDQLIKGETGGW